MYFHRIGRTARARESGSAIDIVTYEKDEVLKLLEETVEEMAKKFDLPKKE